MGAFRGTERPAGDAAEGLTARSWQEQGLKVPLGSLVAKFYGSQGFRLGGWPAFPEHIFLCCSIGSSFLDAHPEVPGQVSR